jgi:hypothetical protein
MSNNENKKLYQRWYVWVLFYPAAVIAFAIEKFKNGEKKLAYGSLVGAFLVTVVVLSVGGTDNSESRQAAAKIQLTPEQIAEKEKKDALFARNMKDREFLRDFRDLNKVSLAFKVSQGTANRDEVTEYNKNMDKMNELIQKAPGKQVTDWICEAYNPQGLNASTNFDCYSDESSSFSESFIQFKISISPENAKQIGTIYKDDKFLVNGVVSKVTNQPNTFSPQYKGRNVSIVTIYISNGSVALRK